MATTAPKHALFWVLVAAGVYVLFFVLQILWVLVAAGVYGFLFVLHISWVLLAAGACAFVWILLAVGAYVFRWPRDHWRQSPWWVRNNIEAHAFFCVMLVLSLCVFFGVSQITNIWLKLPPR